MLALSCALLVAACDRIATGLPTVGVPATARSTTFAAVVVGVTDGDTITVLDETRRELRVRLAEIDAPERGQPWGDRSKQALSDLVYRQSVEIVQTDTDSYGRMVAQVSVDGRNINREMVAIGAAWAFREYLIDDTLIAIERDARTQRLGLWSMSGPNPVEPRLWRRGDREPSTDASMPTVVPMRGFLGQAPGTTPAGGDDAAVRCGSKRYCSQMRTCDEARQYLVQCHVGTLDGDGDGRPCEQLCAS